MDERSLTPAEQREIEELLQSWLRRCRIALSAYNDATTRAVAAERRLGIPAVILSALVATSVFATLEGDPAAGWRIATGFVAVGAALLTALQTFLRQEERAEQFRAAARSYGRLRRRIELAMLFPPSTTGQAAALVELLAEASAEASAGKPNVPQSIWDRAEYKIQRSSDARGLRALRLRLRDRFDFGIAAPARSALPEDHGRYFAELEHATVVPLVHIRPTTPASHQRDSVAVARSRMWEAAEGRRARRPPLDVRDDGNGRFVLVDGNATFAVAEQDGWKTVPVRIVAEAADL